MLPCAAVAVDESASGRVPDVYAFVEGAGGDVLPVGRERHRVDGLLNCGIMTKLLLYCVARRRRLAELRELRV